MIIQRVFVQSATIVTPSTFVTSSELTTLLRACNATSYGIIPVSAYTPNLTVERENSKIIVTATSHANTKKVFSNKISSHRAKSLPTGYVFHFNLDGQVIGVTHPSNKDISLEDTKKIIPSSLSEAPHIIIGNKIDFIGALLKQVLSKEDTSPFRGVLRVGFYMGMGKLRHTNKLAMPGIVAAALPLENGVRIKGIYKHAPDYAETVFWFELKQSCPTIFDILKEEELNPNFMEHLNKCL